MIRVAVMIVCFALFTVAFAADPKYTWNLAELYPTEAAWAKALGDAKADIPKIFEPFYTTKSQGRGTGLGLSICYTIIADHHGRIEVDSAIGRGSTFTVILPVADR